MMEDRFLKRLRKKALTTGMWRLTTLQGARDHPDDARQARGGLEATNR